MDRLSFRPSPWLLACWIAGVTLGAAAVGKAAAGVCKVAAYPADRGFALAFGGAWVLGTLCVAAHFLSLRYALQGHYVSRIAGVLWRHRRSIPLDKITSVEVRQGPLDQLLRMGKIRIYTPSSGSDTPEETLLGVRDPVGVKETILRSAEADLQRAAAEALQETRELRALLAGIDRRLARMEPPGAGASVGPDGPGAAAAAPSPTAGRQTDRALP